jgi:hypothetical protein
MINGAQEVVLDEDWCMLDEFQLVDGEAKDFPTRKSLEGQRLSGNNSMKVLPQLQRSMACLLI